MFPYPYRNPCDAPAWKYTSMFILNLVMTDDIISLLIEKYIIYKSSGRWVSCRAFCNLHIGQEIEVRASLQSKCIQIQM